MDQRSRGHTGIMARGLIRRCGSKGIIEFNPQIHEGPICAILYSPCNSRQTVLLYQSQHLSLKFHSVHSKASKHCEEWTLVVVFMPGHNEACAARTIAGVQVYTD